VLKDYADKAVDYLKKAEMADRQYAEVDPTYRTSTQYVIYRTFRGQAAGRLGVQEIEPFKSQYKQEWQDLIAYLKASDHAIAFENLLYSRFTYAAQLFDAKDPAMEDPAAAKEQLDLLAVELNALEDPLEHGFVRLIMNVRSNPTGTNWVAIQKFKELSPDFGAAVDRLLALMPPVGSETVGYDNY
jgi:hypothetical protein